MLNKDKLEKLKSINNDDSDLIIKFDEYVEREIPFDSKDVYSNIESMLEDIKDDKEQLYVIFSDIQIEKPNCYTIEQLSNDNEFLNEKDYYFGKQYDIKLKKFFIEENLLKKAQLYKKIKFIFDIRKINTFPLWETKMYRRIIRVLEEINELSTDDLNIKTIERIINNPKIKEIKNENKFDIDFIIKYIKELSKDKETTAVYICQDFENKEKFIISDLKKLVHAAKLSVKERNEYIYDTTYKDMNEMFSKFGFCNFKGNKCVSQRHKSITNRYPVPKTDGCCFKVVNKCKHNNKDGTCRVECLPCKLFTCMYLSSLGVGLRIGEILLMRAFLTQKQRRLLIYKFYQPKEYFLKRM